MKIDLLVASTLRAGDRARHPFIAVTLLSLLIWTVASCGYGSKAPKDTVRVDAQGKRLSADAVRIGYFPNLTHATALVGNREGILQSELGGTQLETTIFKAGPAAIEALNAGSIDIGFIGPSPAVNAYTRSGGKNLRIIAGAASGGVKLVVNPKRIKSQGDVQGKRIATPQRGNTQDVAFLNWASEKRWKIDPQSGRGDVSVVRMDNAIVPAAYRSDAIDGAWVPEPTASRLVSQGAKVLLDESTLWPEGKFVTTNVIASQRFLEEHPNVVEAVLRGTVKTNDWIRANPAKAKASVNAAMEQHNGKPLPVEVLDLSWESVQVTNDPLAATLRRQAGHAVQAGLLNKSTLNGIYDLRPLNRVLKAAGRSEVSDAGVGVG